MNNSRNKKLLASFLTALGLTTNSANVSANFSQFLSDARFACKILGGEKAKERDALNRWVTRANNLLNEFKEYNIEESIFYPYANCLKCYKGLFQCIKQMIEHRNGFNSEFVNSLDLANNKKLKEFIDSYNDNSIWYGDFANAGFAKVKYTALLELCKPIYENARGGKCSVWIKNFNKTLKSLCENEDLTKYMIEEEKKNNVQNNNNNFNMQNQNNFNQNITPDNNFNQNNNFNMQNQNNFNQNNNFNMQNNNINQNLISNNNNSQEYYGESWQENCKRIAKVISDDFKDMNGVLQQAINPAYARDWLATMVAGVQKHAIPEIDNAISQNSEHSQKLLTLKGVLQGDFALRDCGDFGLFWDDNFGLIYKMGNSISEHYLFAFNRNHVDVYHAEFFNPIMSSDGEIIDESFVKILSFNLPTDTDEHRREYNVLTPQKKQNMNMMVQNNFGMQNNMNNFNMQNYPNYPNYQSQPNNNGFNNNGNFQQ